jgi:hypothetical protein
MPEDRHSRRRPFTTWMKRLANLKTSSSDSHAGPAEKQKSKKSTNFKHNPYPVSQRIPLQATGNNAGRVSTSVYSPDTGRSLADGSPGQSRHSLPSVDGQVLVNGGRSGAPTISTNAETSRSEAAGSKAGTVATGPGAASNHINGGEGSTFSSPAPSVRSLATTLTTIQSAAPSNVMGGANHHQNSMQFSHPFPAAAPASAIPAHVTGHSSGGHPATYTTATANNLLTDNASILTLASSSKRRRRNSLDTNASVRALAPSSLFGGSRESLPLSVLSSHIGEPSSSLSAHHTRPGVSNPATERASVYSSSGVAPLLTSERSSFYASKQGHTGDGSSVRSGLHGRTDSTTGSIGGVVATNSSLPSPKDTYIGRMSRRSSNPGEVDEESEGGVEKE